MYFRDQPGTYICHVRFGFKGRPLTVKSHPLSVVPAIHITNPSSTRTASSFQDKPRGGEHLQAASDVEEEEPKSTCNIWSPWI